MKSLSSSEIRAKFLSFFEANDHLKIQASSVVPKNDPTLLYINSGMAPLKNYFLGKEEPPQKRLTNFQPCIRTKDIDDVGDRHHLTIFEMMGSWSIGDYYKEEACRLAYSLLVDEFGFDPKKLYMSVYGGSKEKGIECDEESVAAWMKCGVPADHIIRLGEDNFWGPAGDTGPCGPCTEVFYDTGEKFGPEYKPGKHFDDKGRYIEIWNAGVFMELNKNADGSFTPLPLKSVDTGSGLERLAMVINGHESVYETDLMAPIMKLVRDLYGIEEVSKVRMITDHMRASTFILSEGILPSNEGQGYIPRRLIRKCVATLVSHKVKNIDFSPIVEKVISLLSPYYPLLETGKEACLYNLKAEVEEFTPLITQGLVKIDDELARMKKGPFAGKAAFDLVTTYGLPLDVLKATLAEKGRELDEAEYEACYEEHRKKSRVISRKGGLTADQDQLVTVAQTISETEFTGYESVTGESEVIALLDGTQKVEQIQGESDFFFATKATPFYGESGGQVGDCGLFTTKSGARGEIVDTQKIGKVHLHQARLTSGTLKLSDKVTLTVDQEVREKIKRHHSATHLLHSALHAVVGKHAVQKGSMVRADRLRFDFQHNKALSRDELDQIEGLVNQWIRENSKRETNLLSYDDAISAGAMALFGEKYDSKVRVVQFGPSVELCGGTHVDSTGDIGLFSLVLETAVAKGVRRIEAVTGAEAIALHQERGRLLKELSEFLNAPSEQILERVREMKLKLKEKSKAVASQTDLAITHKFEKKLSQVHYLCGEVIADGPLIKELGDRMIEKGDYQVICFLSRDERSLKAFTWVHKDFSDKVKAGDLLTSLLNPVGGKGGGRPQFAQGGSQEVGQYDLLFTTAKTVAPDLIEQRLK